MPRLQPQRVENQIPMHPELLQLLRAMRASNAMRNPADRFVGLHVAFHGPAIGPYRPAFPISGLTAVDEGGQIVTEPGPVRLLEERLTADAWSAFCQCTMHLAGHISALMDLSMLGEDLIESAAPFLKKHGIDIAEFDTFSVVIVPNGYVIYPQWAGEITRCLEYQERQEPIPAGLFRVAFCGGLSSHETLETWTDLTEALEHICAQPYFDGDLQMSRIS